MLSLLSRFLFTQTTTTAAKKTTMAAITMRYVHARLYPNEDNVVVEVPMPPDNKIRTLNRPKAEPVEKGLMRVVRDLEKSMNAPKKGGKKQQQKEQQDTQAAAEVVATPAITVQLVDRSGAIIPLETCHEQAWKEGCVLRLGTVELPVLVNTPRVLSLNMGAPMVGVPMIAKASCEFATNLEWKWSVLGRVNEEEGEEEKVEEEVISFSASSSASSRPSSPAAAVSVTTTTPSTLWSTSTFLPKPQHVGKKIQVECIPIDNQEQQQERRGISMTKKTFSLVRRKPATNVVDRRAAAFQRQSSSSSSVRVVSYNILHDGCAVGEFSETVLYPHCKPEHLALSYRENLLFDEVSRLDADIYCFQEMGSTHYEYFWAPLFKEKGFSSAFKGKAGEANEGGGIAWNNARFEVERVQGMDMREMLHLPHNADIATPALAIPDLAFTLHKSSVCCQFVTLFDKKTGKKMIVVNTHLFYHPGAPHLRAIHMSFLLRQIEATLVTLVPAEEQSKVGIVICGDLNCSHRSGAVQLAMTGRLPPHHRDWIIGNSFSWKKKKEFWEDMGKGKKKEKVEAEEVEEKQEAVAVAESNINKKKEYTLYPLTDLEDQLRKREEKLERKMKRLALNSKLEGRVAAGTVDSAEMTVEEEVAAKVDDEEDEDDEVIPAFAPELTSNLRFKDICVERPEEVPFTHLIGQESRACVLDHILFSPSALNLTRVCPILISPAEADELLPSEFYGSDHLSIGAEFEWVD